MPGTLASTDYDLLCPSCHSDPCMDGTGCAGTPGWRRLRGGLRGGEIMLMAVSVVSLADDFRKLARELRQGPLPRDQYTPRSMARRWHPKRKR